MAQPALIYWHFLSEPPAHSFHVAPVPINVSILFLLPFLAHCKYCLHFSFSHSTWHFKYSPDGRFGGLWHLLASKPEDCGWPRGFGIISEMGMVFCVQGVKGRKNSKGSCFMILWDDRTFRFQCPLARAVISQYSHGHALSMAGSTVFVTKTLWPTKTHMFTFT